MRVTLLSEQANPGFQEIGGFRGSGEGAGGPGGPGVSGRGPGGCKGGFRAFGRKTAKNTKELYG